MLEAMLAGLRIDRHTTDRIKDFSIGRMVGVTVVLMRRVRVMGMYRHSFPTAAARLAGYGGG
ncbi:hypothetical protein NB311A_16739 [Nitrobacter sp. Nb-311A]|nr:hypothetical protein NB311A_16739 [Nitrobacter sp. Nb-311A]